MGNLRLMAALFICVGIAGCGGGSSPTPGSAETEGELPFEYQCYPGFPFDPSEVGNGNAEDGSDAKVQTLRRVLTSYDAESLPKTGWNEISATDDEAGFVARRGEHFFDIRLERSGGEWTPSGWGDCQPQVVIETGSVVQWALQPEANPASEDDVIEVLIHERECTGGRDPRSHVQEPVVVYEQDRIYVALSSELERGSYTCQGNPIVEYTIEFGEPIGERALFDVSFYPPRPAERKLDV